jgi:Rha family phage regulatory protein
MNALTPIVTLKNNAVVANSRDVAKHYGKAHKNLLRDIDSLLLKSGLQGIFTELQVVSRTGFGARSYRTFDMTRKGFLLLVMGFTGKKAVALKCAYIDEFDRMEAALKAVPAVAAASHSVEQLHNILNEVLKHNALLVEQNATFVRIIDNLTQPKASAAPAFNRKGNLVSHTQRSHYI